MTERVVEIEGQVFAEPLPETDLSRVVVRRAESAVGRERRVLRLHEGEVSKGHGGVVPERLHESPVRRVTATHAGEGNSPIRRLGRSQTHILAENVKGAGQTGEEVLEIR